QKLPRIGDVLLHQFLHLLLDFLEILRGEWSRPVEVVEESVFGRRSMAELGLREEFQNSCCQQVSRGVPVNFQRLRILVSQNAEFGVPLQGAGQINKIPIVLGGERRIRQPRTNRLCNIERGRALGNFLHAPIGELHMNAVCHKPKTRRWIESFSLLKGYGRVKQKRSQSFNLAPQVTNDQTAGHGKLASERELAAERLSCSNCVVRPHRGSRVA